MKIAICLLASVAALAAPLTVGTLTTITDQYGILRPVITNNTTNARFFAPSRPFFWTVTQTFANGSTSSYGDVFFGSVLPGQSYTVPAELNAPWIGATSWTFTWFPTDLVSGTGNINALVFFHLSGSATWYYAENRGLTGTITNAAPTGVVRVNNVIQNCWGDPNGPLGCNGGPPPGMVQSQAIEQVPEPGTWAMLALGAGLVGVRRLRRL
jgi:hypothetical protein